MYRFSSKEWVAFESGYPYAVLGLYYYGYRLYAPALQRWLNRDPLEDAEINAGLNLYAFVYNSPTAHIDPFGHDILDDPDSKNHLDKYGDCTKEQHSKLHNAASIACKSSGKMRCEKGGVKLFL